MKLLILIILFALFFVPAFAESFDIIVFEFDATGMDSADAAQISNFMRQRLNANQELQVLQPNSLEYSIAEVTMDNTLAIRLAQSFEADFAIVASLGKIGDLFTIDTRLLSVGTGESFETDGSYEGSLELFLLNTVGNLTDKLIKRILPQDQPPEPLLQTQTLGTGSSWYKKWWLWAGIGGAAVIGGVLSQGGGNNPENPKTTDDYLPEPPALP